MFGEYRHVLFIDNWNTVKLIDDWKNINNLNKDLLVAAREFLMEIYRDNMKVVKLKQFQLPLLNNTVFKCQLFSDEWLCFVAHLHY